MLKDYVLNRLNSTTKFYFKISQNVLLKERERKKKK